MIIINIATYFIKVILCLLGHLRKGPTGCERRPETSSATHYLPDAADGVVAQSRPREVAEGRRRGDG